MTDETRDPIEAAARRRALVGTFMELIQEQPVAYYDDLVHALHDALVLSARLDDEHGPSRAVRSTSESRAIARKRFLAHQLTVALNATADFDRRYPR